MYILCESLRLKVSQELAQVSIGVRQIQTETSFNVSESYLNNGSEKCELSDTSELRFHHHDLKPWSKK